MNLLESYQTIQYTAHQRSQIKALSFDTSWHSWKFEFWNQIYQKTSGATFRSSWQSYSRVIFPVFSKRNVLKFHNTTVCIVSLLLMRYGVTTHILNKRNQNKIRLSKFFIFTPELDHFTTFQQYHLASKKYIHEISIRALIAHNTLIFLNILSYSKGTIIY